MQLPLDLFQKLVCGSDKCDQSAQELLSELVVEVYRQQAGYIADTMVAPLPTRAEIKEALREELLYKDEDPPPYKSQAWLDLTYALAITQNWKEGDDDA